MLGSPEIEAHIRIYPVFRMEIKSVSPLSVDTIHLADLRPGAGICSDETQLFQELFKISLFDSL